MALVAGIDSSTQSCKVVIRDAETGALLRHGRAAHPDGTEVDPASWWTALESALAEAGGIADVVAVAVGAQQHGMVCLDEHGEVVRPALLWNDTRSAGAAAELVAELGGPRAWAEAVGSVPVASFTVTKLRWLAEHGPEHAARTAAVCLPHDRLTDNPGWKPRRSGQGGMPGPPDCRTRPRDSGGCPGSACPRRRRRRRRCSGTARRSSGRPCGRRCRRSWPAPAPGSRRTGPAAGRSGC